MKRQCTALVIMLTISSADAHHIDNESVVSLYMRANGAPTLKAHIATFDAGNIYSDKSVLLGNWEMCNMIRNILNKRAGEVGLETEVTYWCEFGYGMSERNGQRW